MDFLSAVALLGLGAVILVLFKRLSEVERRLNRQAEERGDQERLIARLTERVRVLESTPHAASAELPSPVAAALPSEPLPPPLPPPLPTAPLPASPAPAEAPHFGSPLRACQFCGRSAEPGATVCVCGAVIGAGQTAPPPHEIEPPPLPDLPIPAVPGPRMPQPDPVFAAQPSGPSWREQLREKTKGQEWEAIVGGNWLNKLGVLVLVIGIALFLAYAFTRMGPGGRVATGAGVSLAMLLSGVFIERKPVYRIFARGLIGGGWAALYFTTYAMHAVPAAMVIANPYAATALLLSVALGMIAHSLKYRSQTVSGLAYFIAFATLAMGDATVFSVLALIPLAASLLYVAYRFDWLSMAVLGVFATYATCASRPDTGAPLATTQALFGSYWLLFEVFDLLRVRRGRSGFTPESLIFPLNALGFLGLSLVKWHRAAPEHFYIALAAGAALYLAGALLRVAISSVSWSGYEPPLTLAAALAAWSIMLKAPGMWINVDLLIEAELLFLAGVRFGQAYPRWLAWAVFCLPAGKLIGIDVAAGGSTNIAGRAWMAWSPAAILTAVVFYVNRGLRAAGGIVYSSAAAAFVLLVLGYETPREYLCVAWLLFGAALFGIGYRFKKPEFRWQSYAALLAGTGAGLFLNVLDPSPAWTRPWLPLLASAAVQYAIALRIRFGREGVLHKAEAETVPLGVSLAASGFLAAAVWRFAPAGFLGVAWMFLGAAMLELGLRKLPRQFRWQSYLVSAGGFANLVWFHVVLAEKGSGRAEWLSLTLAAVLCSAISARLFGAMPDRIDDRERGWARDSYAAAATLFVMALAWLELSPPLVALAWAIAGVVLLEIGFAASLVRFRALGNLVDKAVFARLFLANFTDFGQTAGISHRLLTVTPIVIAQYYVWWRYRRASLSEWEAAFARLYLYAPAILTVLLLRFELGRTLTVVGWAAFGLALYAIGLKRDLKDLRWQSYAIAALAFWRSWDTNFYISGSLAGVSGRILTGAVVIASFYAAQLLAPRQSSSPVERYARPYFSLLASALLGVLLFYEVSGGLLTVAWSVEALALLAAGFPLRDRFQRLTGLSLFMMCVLKLFLYDLRRLETLNRILSFIVLGALLVTVSWIYTRFRERLQRYL
jgi:hypothetical protein